MVWTALLAQGEARAQGCTVLWIDTVYAHGAAADTRPEAAFALSGAGPSDWAAPADYARGSVWFRFEVRAKPTLTALRIQPCLERSPNQGGGRSCAPAQALSDTGVYAWAAPLPQWAPSLAWTAAPARIVVVVQDAYGLPVRPGATDWVGNPYFALYYPLQVRFSAAIVPADSAFPGWDALLPTALAARPMPAASPRFGRLGKSAGTGAADGLEIRFDPARTIDAEAHCWSARGRLLASAAWRAHPGSSPRRIAFDPGSADGGPVLIELRAGTDRWTAALAPAR